MFLGYIHSFRALAILFIVAGHAIDAFVWDSTTMERLLRIFISNGSVLFVFIAGYLFQHLANKYKTKKYYISKLKNVILPYFIVSIPAIVVFVTMQEREGVSPSFYDNPLPLQVVIFYATGSHLAPLWFIPMISIFYLLAPLLIKADQNKYIYYAIPVAIVVSCFVDRGSPIESFIHFFSAYLLGMYCSHYKEWLNPKVGHPLALAILLLSGIGLAGAEFHFTNATMTYINYLQKLAMCLFFLGLLFRFNSHLSSKYIALVADTSFGVFFIHSYFLTAGKLINLKLTGSPQQGNLLLYIAVALITLFTCVLVVSLLRSIFGKYSRLLVGS